MTLDKVNNTNPIQFTFIQGIGKTMAKNIVDNRPYKKWSDLLEVPYMNQDRVDRIRKAKTRNNPYNANEKKPDPRQARFLKHFINPESETFANAYRSAKKAGYSDSYAERISADSPKWMSENITQGELVAKAIRNMQELLDEEEDKKLKWKVSEFALERLKRDEFGKNVDVTSGGDKIQAELTDEQRNKLLNELIQERDGDK